jgi:hypothetical protein
MADRDKQIERAREVLEEKQEESKARAQREQLDSHERPPDEPDPRTKSTGHGQKTADKWNQ